MIVLQCITQSFTLSDASDIAQIILALASLVLAFYIFVYQRNKDNKSEIQAARINEQNIKLQWFKELVIQPNLQVIYDFYNNLHSLKNKIDSNTLSEEKKIEINTFIKKELSIIRKSFIDLLQVIDQAFAQKTKENFDNLIDGITEAIFNDELALNDPDTYERVIGSKISYSQNDLFSSIYNLKLN